jgi:hypothetical protein
VIYVFGHYCRNIILKLSISDILVGMLKKEKQKAAEGGYRTDDVRASVVQNRRPDQQQPLVSNGNGDTNNSRVSRENAKGRVWTMDNNNYSRSDSDVKAKKICEWCHIFLYCRFE